VLDDGRYNLRWFLCDQIPAEICVGMTASDEKSDNDDNGAAYHSSSDESD